VRVVSPLVTTRARRRSRWRPALSAFALAAGVLLAGAVLLGLVFAGSRAQLAEGTRVAGVHVGGLTRAQAVAELERRFAALAEEPVTFVAAGERFELTASQLAVAPDFRAAVAAAAEAGDGFGPIRGFRRLHARVFGAEVLPRLAVSSAALEYALDRIAAEVDREPESAALVRRGLRVEVVPARSGRRLEREAAAEAVVRALGALERAGGPVVLPVSTASPTVTAEALASAARRARIALSAPVVLRGPGRSWRLPRWRIAQLLSLPSGGATRLAIAGPDADAYFRALARRVARPAVDAGFDVSGERVRVVPARPGVELDVPRTARALLRAATSPANRVAALTLVTVAPQRTTEEALAMGIDRRLSTYKTLNAGTADRITNLRLGVTLLDDTLVPPGGEFSLNETIGERTAERGFRPAPVIIGTEYAEEVGGGTSQVATTVFNAAWEAGLELTERNPHALYISRYQLGRDATVYWPTLDLKFVNDTKHWILVKGFVEPDGIRVSIYGGERRRVVSSPGTMTITGPVPVRRVKDPTLPKGKVVVEEEGAPPRRTVVTRKVYAADGTLLRSETWTTSYRGQKRVLRIGTKPKKDAPAEPKPPSEQPEAPTGEAVSPLPTRP
jgi:vancomycin resistance protein YoaR